jgi:hypothetical protein
MIKANSEFIERMKNGLMESVFFPFFVIETSIEGVVFMAKNHKMLDRCNLVK